MASTIFGLLVLRYRVITLCAEHDPGPLRSFQLPRRRAPRPRGLRALGRLLLEVLPLGELLLVGEGDAVDTLQLVVALRAVAGRSVPAGSSAAECCGVGGSRECAAATASPRLFFTAVRRERCPQRSLSVTCVALK